MGFEEVKKNKIQSVDATNIDVLVHGIVLTFSNHIFIHLPYCLSVVHVIVLYISLLSL